ncbi:hypothetical protein DUNSADRAFT_17368 [Dunaliella salina]|uniref:Encoded protein n=1 Tax=Dunaliella salina TaxID=3046 RepID=A0ABQ7H081_DUNSA|nr:hypothetical protein DUNSADRAFT_17368 [Dunaliella salina]|eukprot:KAF5840265.1 hypothetical protein DUNSADRAFT_17368 [Dunaliella salina]
MNTTSTSRPSHNCACENNFCPHCGLPACRPVRPLKFVDGALQSTYDRDYDGKRGQPSGLCGLARKEKAYVPPSGKMSDKTTQRVDFPPKQGQYQGKRGPERTPMPYRPFDASTTYNTVHTPKPIPEKEPPKPRQTLDSPPFQGTTSYASDYQPKPIPKQTRHVPDQELLDLPFLGNSTYRDDFTPKPMPARDPKPPPTLLPSKNDLNYTTYGKDFVPKPLPERREALCCDVPSHTQSFQHSHSVSQQSLRGSTRESRQSKMLGNSTGRLYSVN